jgi:PAT family beta-lactamase induction signal transducer AmpG
MVEKLGYHNFFLATALMGVPTLFMIALHWAQEARKDKRDEENKTAETPVSEQP